MKYFLFKNNQMASSRDLEKPANECKLSLFLIPGTQEMFVSIFFWVPDSRFALSRMTWFGYLKSAFLIPLILLILSGCESMPNTPKKPDPCPRIPINKGVPPELSHSKCLFQGESE
jgi:hypothetical protein